MSEVKTITDLVLPKGKQTRFVFFSGKGGVGKTVMAAATAIWLSEHGYKTLILSTDLQKSLNDIFEQETVGKETPIKGVTGLKAMSVETAESLQRHQEKMMRTLEILDPESLLVKEYKQRLEQPSECACQQVAYFEFVDYLNKEGEYDVMVFDTAPTGQTLQLVRQPIDYTLGMIQAIKNRKRLAKVLGKKEVEQQIKGLEEMKSQEERAVANLRSDKTSFMMVMIPEAMPLAELERNIPALEEHYKIPVRGIVINGVLPEEVRDAIPYLISRWAMQKKYIDLTYEKFKGKIIAEVPLLETEVLGVDRIKRIAHALYEGRSAWRPPRFFSQITR